MQESEGLRIIIFDRTCTSLQARALSHIWRGGTKLYAALGRVHMSYGAHSWDDALTTLAAFQPSHPIAELQYWGHGKWGRLFIDRDVLDRSAFSDTHPHYARLRSLRDRLTSDALLWFRTCETFGANAGKDFAAHSADFFGCRTAGHTYVIGYWQSGLHSLAPGMKPEWQADEGLVLGDPQKPLRAAPSAPREPNTISCLTGRIPTNF